MSRLLITIASLLLLLICAPLRAESQGDFVAARGVFLQALEGKGDTAAAVSRFEKLASSPSPNEPLYRAYLGAARSLEGRDAWMPWNKMKLTERGLDMLEKALRSLELRHDRVIVEGTPLSLELRLVAGSTFIAVPGFFKRGDLGRKVLREALASPVFVSAPVDIRARLYQQAALAANQDGKPTEETAHLKRLLEILPSGALAQQARQRLKELKA